MLGIKAEAVYVQSVSLATVMYSLLRDIFRWLLLKVWWILEQKQKVTLEFGKPRIEHFLRFLTVTSSFPRMSLGKDDLVTDRRTYPQKLQSTFLSLNLKVLLSPIIYILESNLLINFKWDQTVSYIKNTDLISDKLPIANSSAARNWKNLL